MEDYGWPIVLTATGVVTYYGYYYLKFKVTNHILTKVQEKLDSNMDKEMVSFRPIPKTKSALISFTHGGKQHHVSVPYDRSKGRKMGRNRVFLVGNVDHNTITYQTDITHKPGIPYLLSADDMGGDKIIVMKDGIIVKEYSGDEIPNWLD